MPSLQVCVCVRESIREEERESVGERSLTVCIDCTPTLTVNSTSVYVCGNVCVGVF